MGSTDHRFVYLGEVATKAIRDSFPPPPASEVFSALAGFHGRNLVPQQTVGVKTISLSDIALNDGICSLLFRVTDPTIPDNALEDKQKRTVRIAVRGANEVPARSAHVIINIDPAFDSSGAYPAAIEQVEYVSPTLMLDLLNRAMADLLTEKRASDDSGKLKVFSPRVDFRGHPSQSFEKALRGGYEVQGVQFAISELKEDAFGDKAYPIVETREVILKIRGGLTGVAAVDWVKEKIIDGRKKGLGEAKLLFVDEYGAPKRVNVTAMDYDVERNFFVLKKKIDGFKNPLGACETAIRGDVVEKMLEHVRTLS